MLISVACATAQDVNVGVGVSGGNASASFQVLTSGPVHETYASPILFDTGAVAFIEVDPPPLINEIPPLERPAGFSEWVPGYWNFDDARRTWIWVSGTWRIPPPGYTWVEGYWVRTAQGWRYVSGYWTPAAVDAEIVYLPAPPATLEAGPIGTAPFADAIWAPGAWMWSGNRYAWRDGYWIQARADWIWTPAEYVWTPAGYIYVDSHWDHLVPNRGFLYAPVLFNAGVNFASLTYSPSYVVNVGLFTDGFFVRPSLDVYLFGDYYATTWWDLGVYPAFAFHMTRFGYDPIFAFASWRYGRTDGRWLEERRQRFLELQTNEAARPPRTLDEQAKAPAGGTTAPVVVAAKDLGPSVTPLTVERAPESARDQLVATSKERRQAEIARMKVETEDGKITDPKPPEQPRRIKAPKERLPRAAEAAKAPTAPEKPRAPKADPERQPTRGEQAAKPLPEPTKDRAVDHLGRGADARTNGNRPDERANARRQPGEADPRREPPKPDQSRPPPPAPDPNSPQPPKPEAERPQPPTPATPKPGDQPPPQRRPEGDRPPNKEPPPKIDPPARRPDVRPPPPKPGDQPPPQRPPEAGKPPAPAPKPDPERPPPPKPGDQPPKPASRPIGE